jgi:hypothetical protein
MNGYQFCVLAIVTMLCAVPVALVVWFAARVVKKNHDQQRDLLKSVLALSPNPQGASLAGALEGTERAEIQSDVDVARAKANGDGARRFRTAGAG